METQWKITLIKHRINTAFDNLEMAKLSIEKNKSLIASRDLYYAFFQMVLALLLTKNIQVKTHVSVLNKFSLEFVKSGYFDPLYGRLFGKLMNLRNKADYSEYFDIANDDLIEFLKQTEHFLSLANDYLENWINQQQQNQE